MAPPTEPKIRVAIAGGGIAGLALAAGLIKKPHLDVHVYESVAAFKDVGAGLALHMNAIKAMTLIGPEVHQAYLSKALEMGEEDVEMSTKVILAHGPAQGELVAELGKAKGRKTVSRADLLDGFLALVPQRHISFGKRLAEIKDNGSAGGDPGVQVSFTDGTTANVHVLLGSDGIHSLTRSYVLGPDHPATAPKNHDGWRIYRTMVSTEFACQHINPEWTQTVPILIGPRGHINCIPLNKGTRLSAGVAVRGAVKPVPENRSDKMQSNGESGETNASTQSSTGPEAAAEKEPGLDTSLYSDYSDDARKIVSLVARDTSASWTAADHDHAPTFFRGNVAMVGDAAHASLPFAGNGAAQALEDAAVLNDLFLHCNEPQQIPALLQAYDEVRRPRSQAVVDLARKFGRVYAFAEDGMHNDPERLKRFFAEAAGFTNLADVKGQNERAVRIFKEKTQLPV